MKFYAAYNDSKSEVFIFDTQKDRDAWVQSDDTIFYRKAINEAEAKQLAGDNFDHPVYDDDFHCQVAENHELL